MSPNPRRHSRPSRPTHPAPSDRSRLPLWLGSVLIAAASPIPSALAQDATEAARLEKLEQENLALRTRLDSLEDLAKKEGLVPSGTAHTGMVKALSDITLSGFVQASYFYDTSTPGDRRANGHLWNTSQNSFSLNKVKVTLASAPVERSGEKWDAGYRVSLMWGEDAAILNTGGEVQGLENVREAYVEMNVPLGTGLNVRAGQMISLLNYESGDGGAANANFSQGYQWFYTGNGPGAGAQLGYSFTDWLDLKVRLQNGMYAGAIDNNKAKTFIGSIGLKPSDKVWVNLIGWVGDETDTSSVAGASVLAGASITKAFGVGLEADYFIFNPDGPAKADLWSIGGWFTYDLTDKTGLALRVDYLNDPDGGGIPGIALGGRPGSAILSPDAKGDLGSVTLTFNWKPFASIKIQPELRYDYTGYKGGFDGEDSRFIVGVGASYLF